MTLAFSEIDDKRQWNEYKELLEVPKLSDSPSQYAEALALANSFKEKYKDFDHLYSWMAHAHRRQKNYDLARQILQEGLQMCRRKYNLCSYLGLTEFEAGNLTEAVRWWIQSVLLQESQGEYHNHNPFLYLGYVCQPFGLNTLSDRLIAQCDRIEIGRPRLIEKEADKLFSMVMTAKEAPLIRKALELLNQNDLKPNSASKVQPPGEATQENFGAIPRQRNPMDAMPRIVEWGEVNPNKEKKISYTLTQTCLGSPTSIQAITEQYCVYCGNFGDPEFHDPAFPDGGGYCSQWNGAVGFRDSCKNWEPTIKVKYWLSEGYMLNNKYNYPKTPWYQVFDDGPDGAKGAK